MSGDGPRITPVVPDSPKQERLPLPDPPARPFVALARESRVGGPVRKLVYMMVATFCPLMARSWVATGRIKRETLRQACELKKVDTLDTHLRQLRDDGFLSWRRTPGASIFEVRLSPLRVLEAMAHSAKRFGPKAVARAESISNLHQAGQSAGAPAVVSPSQGGAAFLLGRDPPVQGESGGPVPPSDTPSQGELPGALSPVSPSTGDSSRTAGAALQATVSPWEGESPPVPGSHGPPIEPPLGSAAGVSGSSGPVGRTSGSSVVARGSPVEGQAEPASPGESPVPVPGGAEEAAEGDHQVTIAAAAAGAVALAPAVSAPVAAPVRRDRRFKLLEVAADRLFAARAAELWHTAPDVAVQAQISAAVRFRDGHRWSRHAHRSDEEVLVSVGMDYHRPWKTVVQRCECGAVRFATLDRNGVVSEYVPWTLCGFVARFVTDEGFYVDRPPPTLACEAIALEDWAEPLHSSDIEILREKGGADGERLPAPVEPRTRSAPAAGSQGPAVEPSSGLVSCPRCGGRVPLSDVGVAGCVLCL